MDREKIFKNKMGNIIKMNTNNIKMQFKNFKGQNNFNAKVDVIEVETKDQLNKIIKDDTGKKYKYYFEWTDYKSIVKPYYDIDIWIEGHGDEWKEQIPTFQKKYEDLLKKIYPFGDVAISSSHGVKGKTKKGKELYGHAISFHYIVNNYESSIQDLRTFNDSINIFDDVNIDKGVYRDGGNMRAIHSNKPSDPRTFIPENFKDDMTYHVIQSNELTQKVKCLCLPNDYSPAVSPPSSDDEVVDEVVDKEDDEIMEFKPIEMKNEYDVSELKKILWNCQNDDCFSFDTWIKIGMALHNITDGDDIGLALWNDWSKEDDNYDEKKIKSDWTYWTKQDKKTKKIGMTFLRKLNDKYKPIEINDSLESLFKHTLETNFAKRLQFWTDNGENEEDKPDKGKFVKRAMEDMLKVMNTKLIFCKETGDYILLDKKVHVQDNEIKIYKDCWYLKTPAKAKDHYNKEIFTFSYKDPNGKDVNKKINPFKEWTEWIDRREVRAIGFDPREKANDDIFNLWNGFNISKEQADEFNIEDADPIVNHIKKSWCNGDEESFQYIMSYLSHIIQKPHVKTGVMLALKSGEGGGKGMILDILGRIIGEDHYCQNSNAKFLFGDFNGQLEGKICVNLDEAFWGGDKQLEGIVKNKITERRQTINKKNKENYTIDDYANYIITTNNDWFSGVNADSRRVYCVELNNFLSGRMTKEKEEYVKGIVNAPIESFAKVLYNWDITDFNPRIFKKTPLLQNQVERNWNSVNAWWNNVMQEGGFMFQGKFVEWGQLWNQNDSYEDPKKCGTRIKNKVDKSKKTIYYKDWIYDCYNQFNSDTRKFQNNRFFCDLKNNCLENLYEEKKIQIKGERRIFLIPPTLQEARDKWNELQQFNYEYEDEDDEWEVDDSDDE
tara:strand:+ start:2927 stop:5596 length:2670 start_codon:yes stop_codon:yes gene_type:complete